MAEAFEALIAALAGKQHGYVTAGAAAGAWDGRRAINYRVADRPADTGLRRRLRGRVRPDRRRWRGRTPQCWPAARRRRSATARRQPLGVRQALGHAVRGDRAVDDGPERASRSTGSRTLVRRDVTRQLGIPVTSPARTVLDNAPRLDRQAPLPVRQRRAPHALSARAGPRRRAEPQPEPSGHQADPGLCARADELAARGRLPGVRAALRAPDAGDEHLPPGLRDRHAVPPRASDRRDRQLWIPSRIATASSATASGT